MLKVPSICHDNKKQPLYTFNKVQCFKRKEFDTSISNRINTLLSKKGCKV